ncbi:melanocortin receptor 4-like [Montipora capricornis]|uniref:melanocortin receptor 4-like n=1 Tax=Montipora capricornis TaxID=246305 RepID=UPI0035F16A45
MNRRADEFYFTIIANGVFNALLCLTATILNSITIQAIRRTSSLPKPLKAFHLSLAVSDLCVGLIVHPLYVALLIAWSENSTTIQHTNITAFLVPGYFLCYASFLSVLALTVDRFLAITFHLRYQEIVTHNRAVFVVILSFLVSGFLSTVGLWFTREGITITLKSQTVFAVLCLIIIAILYCKIYLTVRRHRKQIQVLQVREQNGRERANAARRFKLAGSTFCVYLVFVVCYLPHICIDIVLINSGPSKTISHFKYYFWTLVLLNSSLNPLIYCWKMRDIRQSVIDILLVCYNCFGR